MKKYFLFILIVLSINSFAQSDTFSAKLTGIGDHGWIVPNTGLTKNTHTHTTYFAVKHVISSDTEMVYQNNALMEAFFVDTTMYINIATGDIPWHIQFSYNDTNWHNIAIEYKWHQYGGGLYIPNIFLDKSSVYSYPLGILGCLDTYTGNMSIGTDSISGKVLNGSLYNFRVTDTTYEIHTDTCIIPTNFIFSAFSRNIDSFYYDSSTVSTLGYSVNPDKSPCSYIAIDTTADTTADTTVVTPTLVLNVTQHAIEVFPNPTNSIVNISCAVKIEKIELLNLLGQVIFTERPEKNNLQIDLADLNKGIYLLKINNTYFKKILKN